MGRAKAKGTLMESKVVGYLRARFDDIEETIHRATLHGTRDVGDIHGLKHRGKSIVIEVKNCRKFEPKEWLRQAERERGNADATYGIVVFHVNGIGLEANIGEQGVLMTLDTLCRMIGADDESD